MKLIIQVEQRHVEAAIEAYKVLDADLPSCCPVAQALHEQGHPKARVFRRTLSLEKGTEFPSPEDVKEYTVEFDYNHKTAEGLYPRTFEIEVP